MANFNCNSVGIVDLYTQAAEAYGIAAEAYASAADATDDNVTKCLAAAKTAQNRHRLR